MTRKQIVIPKRGEIFLVNFDPTVGAEINKTRPALVIQNNTSNTYSPVTIVAAITSSVSEGKLYPTEVFISAGEGGLLHDSVVLLNQIHTIDRARLVKKLGSITVARMDAVSRALTISLDTEIVSDDFFGLSQGREVW
jgi:mRNA interferase MazF